MTIVEPQSKKLGYRWWTVKVWWNRFDGGLKLGPLTVAWYAWTDHTSRLVLSVLGWRVMDSRIRTRRAEKFTF